MHGMKRRIMITVLCVMATSDVYATGLVAASDEAAYTRCLRTLEQNPKQAHNDAVVWVKRSASPAAYHCRAMAEFRLKRYAHAATTLNQLHDLLPRGEERLRRNVFLQAVKSWRLAGEHNRPLKDISAFIHRLQSVPLDAATEHDLAAALTERSALYVASGQRLKALHDLDHVLSFQPDQVGALLARAEIYALMKEVALAKADVEVVLRQNPGHKEAQRLLAKIVKQ